MISSNPRGLIEPRLRSIGLQSENIKLALQCCIDRLSGVPEQGGVLMRLMQESMATRQQPVQVAKLHAL